MVIGVESFQQRGYSSLRRRNGCYMQCDVRRMRQALKQWKCVCSKITPRLKGSEEEKNAFKNVVRRKQEESGTVSTP